MIRIETDRLILREMTMEKDLDFLAKLLADPEVMRFYPKTYSREEAKFWVQRQLDRYQSDGHAMWIVERRSDGERVGQVGLVNQKVEDRIEPEIGYLIYKEFWQQGYATEAAIGCYEYATGQLDLPYVCSLVRPANIPSQRTALKVGMRPTKLVRFYNMEHLLFKRDAENQE